MACSFRPGPCDRSSSRYAIEAERRGLFRAHSRAATNCKFCASLTSRCHVLCFAESQELIWIEDHRSNDEAVSLGLFHLALGSRLPGIEFRWKLVTVIHDLPDALVVFASKPSCEVWHVNVPRKPNGTTNEGPRPRSEWLQRSGERLRTR